MRIIERFIGLMIPISINANENSEFDFLPISLMKVMDFAINRFKEAILVIINLNKNSYLLKCNIERFNYNKTSVYMIIVPRSKVKMREDLVVRRRSGDSDMYLISCASWSL